jgi:hypothetical protein
MTDTTLRASLDEFTRSTVLDVETTIENVTGFLADARHAQRIQDAEVGRAIEELQYRRAAAWLRKAADLLDQASIAVSGHEIETDDPVARILGQPTSPS